MQLEFHQLDRRWEHLRARQPRLQRRLLASLAESGQQTPIVVVVAPDHPERYLVIDGHKRIAALQQLGRDTVEATVWAMSEAEALLLERSLRFGRQETALEQGWLLAEMEQRFGYSIEEPARRFDRSASWVSRRLALVELLPEAIQQQVREGAIAAQVATRYLAPVARVNRDHCERMAAEFVQHHCDTRQAGQLYAAWRAGSRVARERILAEPELFLKTQRQPPAPPLRTYAAELERDLELAVASLERARRRLAQAMPEMDGRQRPVPGCGRDLRQGFRKPWIAQKCRSARGPGSGSLGEGAFSEADHDRGSDGGGGRPGHSRVDGTRNKYRPLRRIAGNRRKAGGTRYHGVAHRRWKDS